jgi:hypothetical protein
MEYDEEKDFGFFGKRVSRGCSKDDDSGIEEESEGSRGNEGEKEQSA